ncbi:MAG: hypothetical protein WD490_06735 [Opitutales bacterium]
MKINSLSSLAVGVTGLCAVLKSLQYLPSGVSWLIYLIFSEYLDAESSQSLTVNVVVQLSTFAVFVISGVLLLLFRHRISSWLCGSQCHETSIELSSVSRPLVGSVGLWFLIYGLTFFITTSAREDPRAMKIPYYIAFGLQALSGLYLVLANKTVSRNLFDSSVPKKELQKNPGL